MDRKTQAMAVKKVKEEMEMAEQFLKGWNASWFEQFTNAYCKLLHFETIESEIRDMERNYGYRYKLENAYYSAEPIGVPLVTETLVGKDSLNSNIKRSFDVEFGTIQWLDINSNKSKRELIFNNDGTIKLFRHGKKRESVYYDASFNVLLNDFDLSIFRVNGNDDYVVSLKDQVLKSKINNIEITRYLGDGKKIVRITKKRSDNVSFAFEACFGLDNNLKYGVLAIHTHKKSNGKVNGTYQFNFSEEKGIRANVYSRKGNKIDISNNPEMLYSIGLMIEPIFTSEQASDMTIANFINAICTSIANGSNTVDFNAEPIRLVEKDLIDLVKGLRSEIPLTGLVTRISDSLAVIGDQSIKPVEKVKEFGVKS